MTGIITIAAIQKAVTGYFGISRNDLLSPRRERHIVRPRQIVMYLCRELTQASFPAIGRMLGDRDHTTVMYGAAVIAKLRLTNPKLRREVDAIRSLLSEEPKPEPLPFKFGPLPPLPRNSLIA